MCARILGTGRNSRDPGVCGFAWLYEFSPELLNFPCVALEMVTGWIDPKLIIFFKKKLNNFYKSSETI